MSAPTNQLVNKAEADMVAGIETSRQAYENSQWIVIAFALASIMLALALGYTISWSLIGPVKQIEAQLKPIRHGVGSNWTPLRGSTWGWDRIGPRYADRR